MRELRQDIVELSRGEDKIFIRSNDVCSVSSRDQNINTQIELTSGSSLLVSEPIQEVLKKIDWVYK